MWDARAAGQDKALLHLATGLGKTTVAALDVMKFRDECAQLPQPLIPRVLYVSHKNEINEQAEATFKRHMPDLETATFNTRQKQLPDADVTFATFQSLHGKLDRFDPQDYEYIVWDEGHHTKAETYMEVVKYFDPLFEMAITATPDRMDGQDIREYFGEEVYSKGLPEAIAEGWLANVDYQIVFDKAIKDTIADGFNPKTLKDIKELFAEKPPAQAIAKNIREEIAKLDLENPKTIVFAASIEEADEMAEELGGVAYHSDTKDRPRILQDFRDGRERIITTRDMFNEGVDIPDAELVVFLRSTASSNIFEQQLGRGLRLAPGKDKVYVLDFVANIERIAKIRELGQAIQQRTEQIGEQTSEEGVILGGEADEPGLRIRSHHGNFDFDKIAVDLLEKWGSLERAGLNVNLLRMTNAQLVTLALQLKTDGPLSFPEIDSLSKDRKFPSTPTIKKRFGSIRNFLEACGFQSQSENPSDEDLITIALQRSPNAPLSQDDINNMSRGGASVLTNRLIENRFGSLSGFHEACGFESLKTRDMTNEEIVALALQLNPKRPLTSTEISNLSKEKRFVSWPTIRERFGSLKDFRKACGFDGILPSPGETINPRTLSNQDILAFALSISPDGDLGYGDITRLGKEGKFVGINTIVSRFGGVKKFREVLQEYRKTLKGQD